MHNGKEEFLDAINRREREANKSMLSRFQGNELYFHPIDFAGFPPGSEMATPPFTAPEKFRNLTAGITTLFQPGWKINMALHLGAGNINGHELTLFLTHTDKKALLKEEESASIIKPQELPKFPDGQPSYLGQMQLGRALDPYLRDSNYVVDYTSEVNHKIHIPVNDKKGFFHRNTEYITMYQEGVRDINLRLVPISHIVSAIDSSLLNPHTDEYVEEATKRRDELMSRIVSQPMEIFSFYNSKPLPYPFRKELEKLQR
jgi:hypothetical protein